MVSTDLVMYEEEFKRIDEELQNLRAQANASVVFLVDKNGQLIATAGDTQDVDTTSLASLTAGNIAATGGIAKLLGDRLGTAVPLTRLAAQRCKRSIVTALGEIASDRGSGRRSGDRACRPSRWQAPR